MRETIRHCVSCILPCGALDVVRVVHANGRVEEFSHEVQAGEVMQAHPKHVLRELPSAYEEASGPRGPVILPPTAELRRGKIYFLMPVSSLAEKKAQPKPAEVAAKRNAKKKKQPQHGDTNDAERLRALDQYLSEILSEKVSAHRDRRRGRVGVWRPHLESISELSGDF